MVVSALLTRETSELKVKTTTAQTRTEHQNMMLQLIESLFPIHPQIGLYLVHLALGGHGGGFTDYSKKQSTRSKEW
jgi:Na+/glutamate symporter